MNKTKMRDFFLVVQIEHAVGNDGEVLFVGQSER